VSNLYAYNLQRYKSIRAEEQKGIAESPFVGDGEISAFLRSHEWSQMPLGNIETWSDSFKTAVQILLTELNQVKSHPSWISDVPDQTAGLRTIRQRNCEPA